MKQEIPNDVVEAVRMKMHDVDCPHKDALSILDIKMLAEAAITALVDMGWMMEDHSRVTIPAHEDEAAMMVILGTNFLENNAPHRLHKYLPLPSQPEQVKRDGVEGGEL